MVVRIHDTYYDAKATLLSDDAIKKIRESRGAILSQRVLDKNFKTDKSKQNLEVVPPVLSTSTPTMKIPKKNGQKKKDSHELEIRQKKMRTKMTCSLIICQMHPKKKGWNLFLKT
ncbi:6787_t:CDS:2 [Racocetra persica]|uniref:6787_t:CDS:1 n=1 Tax=Racocetra persica TaxID=160502 RepID=A0ACA9L387_9GLOM|nr:6787_t:CDS:2 [Racocetra persica]